MGGEVLIRFLAVQRCGTILALEDALSFRSRTSPKGPCEKGLVHSLCVDKEVGHLGQSPVIWRVPLKGKSRPDPILSSSLLPSGHEVNRPFLPQATTMVCSATPSPKQQGHVTMSLWNGNPKETFPGLKQIILGILSQWQRADQHRWSTSVEEPDR